MGSSLSPAIFNIFINAFIIKLREVNTGCTINGVFVGCIMYADDLIRISATVNGLLTLLNFCDNVNVNLQIKFNCAKSSCFVIGKGHAFDISNMQLGNNSISWSSSFKYPGVSFIAGCKLSVDIDVLRRTLFSACNCILGITKYQSEILKLTLQESYTLYVLQYGARALRYTKSQLEDLNVCWNLVYRKIFHFNKFDSVRCFKAGLGRLDFYHLHLFLSLRFIKCAYFSSNAVFKSLVHLNRLTAEYNSICSVAGITNIKFDKLPVSSLKYLILDVFKSNRLT